MVYPNGSARSSDLSTVGRPSAEVVVELTLAFAISSSDIVSIAPFAFVAVVLTTASFRDMHVAPSLEHVVMIFSSERFREHMRMSYPSGYIFESTTSSATSRSAGILSPRCLEYGEEAARPRAVAGG